MFDQTKVFSLCRIVSGSESSPALVHTSLGVNPFKRVELQQHKAAISPKDKSLSVAIETNKNPYLLWK